MKKVKDESVHPAISLNSADGLTVLYGQPHAIHIALQALVDHALTGHPVVYLDGLHTFDALLVGRLARHRRHQPRKALSMIHVARVFSAKPLERLVSHCLVDALERYQAHTAVISGLLENPLRRLFDRPRGQPSDRPDDRIHPPRDITGIFATVPLPLRSESNGFNPSTVCDIVFDEPPLHPRHPLPFQSGC
jgi:hypothetical protein